MDTDLDQSFPPCFASWADYNRWKASENREDLPAQHCTDCLPSFKVRMLRLGRCEHPETQFSFRVEHGFNDGADLGLRIFGTWRARKIIPIVKETKPRKTRVVQDTDTRRQERMDFWRKHEQLLCERFTRYGRG